jgi:hypothetical protein
MEYFNKKICDHQFIPIKTTSAIKISPQLNSSSFNTLNTHRSNKCIFHKKKISDLSINNKYFNLQRTNKKIEDDRPLTGISHVDSFEFSKHKLKKEHINCNDNVSHPNMILACDIFNNNSNNINLSNMTISPKKLEKYFNPNQISKENLSFKNKYIKIPEEKENIDINNITFKKPFYLSKNIKMRNNTTKEMNKKSKTDANNKNIKMNISSFNTINNKKIFNHLCHNISYHNNNQTDSISINKKSSVMNSYRIKNMKKQYKEIPYNYTKETIKSNRGLNSFKRQNLINDEYSENIININQKKYIIRSYNSNNTDINIIKEKLRKYMPLNKSNKDNNSKKNNKNSKKLISELDNEKNMIRAEFISQKNKPSIINYQFFK